MSDYLRLTAFYVYLTKLQSNNFPILEFGWSASEELKLLDALSDCGPGNWGAIASQVGTKTKEECEAHYTKCYVINAKYPLPGKFKMFIGGQ